MKKIWCIFKALTPDEKTSLFLVFSVVTSRIPLFLIILNCFTKYCIVQKFIFMFLSVIFFELVLHLAFKLLYDFILSDCLIFMILCTIFRIDICFNPNLGGLLWGSFCELLRSLWNYPLSKTGSDYARNLKVGT